MKHVLINYLLCVSLSFRCRDTDKILALTELLCDIEWHLTGSSGKVWGYLEDGLKDGKSLNLGWGKTLILRMIGSCELGSGRGK
jgi:hypothetical protein